MRDALGGTVTLAIIVVFIVIVSGYMAFNVNYTKAFRMKNKIISEFEEHNGDCFSTTSTCYKNILNYSRTIGYNPATLNCSSVKVDGKMGKTDPSNLYCYFEYKKVNSSEISEFGNYHYYKILTKIDINIPVIENVFGYRVLSITGDTKTFKE